MYNMKIGNGKLFFVGEYQTANGEYLDVSVYTECIEEITDALDSAFGYSQYNRRWASSNISRILDAQAKVAAEKEAKVAAEKEALIQSLSVEATFGENKSGKFAIVGNYHFYFDSYTRIYKCQLSISECAAAAERFGIGNLYHSYGIAVTTIRKGGGWVEHRIYEAWRIPIKNSNEILLFCNGVQRH